MDFVLLVELVDQFLEPGNAAATYGMLYGMRKTTLYLPDELKERVEIAARAAGRSEADVIRDAIAVAVAVQRAPDPRIPLPGMSLGDPSVAERAGELLDGFGE